MMGYAISAFCTDQLWPRPMHAHCAGRFLHHKSGEGAGRELFHARCSCPCHGEKKGVPQAPQTRDLARERPGESRTA